MITIRPSAEADIPAILDLVKELAAYLNVPNMVRTTVESMKEDQQYFRCLVAENEQSEVVGIATFFPAYYTWFGKSIFLDDLYVKQSSRGLGIGKQLLDAVVNIARAENCKHVRWQVSDWNTSAIKFYEKYGAEIDLEQRNCDLDV